MPSSALAKLLLELPSGRLQVHDLQRELKQLKESTNGRKDELSERLRIALEKREGDVTATDKLLFLKKELSAIDGYKVKPLKARLAARKLKVSGTKAVLATRLRDALKNEAHDLSQKLKMENREKENRTRQRQFQAPSAATSLVPRQQQATSAILPQNRGNREHTMASALPSRQQQAASATTAQSRGMNGLQAGQFAPVMASAFASAPLTSPSGSISAEQRARMEANRKRALEIKAAKQERERKLQKRLRTMETSGGVKLSQEQKDIVDLAQPPSLPSTNMNGGRLIRITAAAGTGKTTTLINLALRCIGLGHRHLTYVTYTKAAAADGELRIRKTMTDQEVTTTQVDALTLHACAMRLLADGDDTDGVEDSKRLIDDEGIRKMIGDVCKKDIEAYLDKAYAFISSKNVSDNASSLRSKHERARAQAIFFIWKSLVSFCRSKMSEESFADDSNYYRHYYPVKSFHLPGADGEKLGFPPDIYSRPSVYKFYADMAVTIWNHIIQHNVKSYDIEMKRAQLKGVRIPGTALLVDECQDMDLCQVSWVASQLNFGTHVYFVGDAAQAIYSFRGAKSKFVMSLDNAIDKSLTTSWRFGNAIAQVANTILFAKQYSPQTTDKCVSWNPYRVTGAADHTCSVTTESLLSQWKEERPLTLIAFGNATLMFKVMDLLGMSHLMANDESDKDCEGPSVPSVTPESDDEFDFPKIHINGKGETSGRNKWKIAEKQVEELFKLYKSGNEGICLPEHQFREFAGETVTWSSFVKDVDNRELARYAQAIKIVQSFKDKTLEAMGVFAREVLDKNFKATDADIILSTCHSAKGMEWDRVELCDDFINLAKYKQDGRLRRDVAVLTKSEMVPKEKDEHSHGVKAGTKTRKEWQFGAPSFGDDLNLLYVACTRAKKCLSIPQSLRALYEEFDMFHDYVQGWKKVSDEGGENASMSEDVVYLKADGKLSKKDICNIYGDLCVPLRSEVGLLPNDKFVGKLIPMPPSNEDTSGIKITEESPFKCEPSSGTGKKDDAAAALIPSQSYKTLEGISIYRKSNSGFGISLGLNKDGRVAVLSLKEGGPAAAQGSLNPGDIVLKINGKNARGWPLAMVTNEVRGTERDLPLLMDVVRCHPEK